MDSKLQIEDSSEWIEKNPQIPLPCCGQEILSVALFRPGPERDGGLLSFSQQM